LSAISQPTTVLLDKSVVREALRAVQRLQFGQTLPERQSLSRAAIVAAIEQGLPVFISRETHHILLRLGAVHVARVLLPELRVLTPGRYLKRGARRLREEGLSREDAIVISCASFGVDDLSEKFGADVVLTTDYALKTRFEACRPRIRERFDRMTRRRVAPNGDATLPEVLAPEELLRVLLR
jgi:hypothetical protein